MSKERSGWLLVLCACCAAPWLIQRVEGDTNSIPSSQTSAPKPNYGRSQFWTHQRRHLQEEISKHMAKPEMQELLINVRGFFTHVNWLAEDAARRHFSKAPALAPFSTLQERPGINDSPHNNNHFSTQKLSPHSNENAQRNVHLLQNDFLNIRTQTDKQATNINPVHAEEDGDEKPIFRNRRSADDSNFEDLQKGASSLFQESLLGSSLPADDAFLESTLSQFQTMMASGEHTFGSDSSSCLSDLYRLYIDFKNNETWTWQFLDAWAKPTAGILELELNWAGNYDECRHAQAPAETNGNEAVAFSGKYCVLGLKAAFELPGMASLMDKFTMQAGLCVPDSCSDADMDLLMKIVLSAVPANVSSLVYAAPSDCHVEHRNVTTATVIAILIWSVLGSLVLVGTITEIGLLVWSEWGEEIEHVGTQIRRRSRLFSERITSNSHRGSIHTEYEPIIGNLESVKKQTVAGSYSKPKWYYKVPSVLRKFVIAFSAYSNTRWWLNTTQVPGSVPITSGVRILTNVWVLTGEFWRLSGEFSANSYKATNEWFSRRSFDFIMNGDFAVDTYLSTSGFLTAYFTLMHLKRTGWRINWPGFYIMRFWRLTPPYLIMLVSIVGLQRFFGSGALWATEQPRDKQYCEDRWWTNVLYISNLVEPGKICVDVSWYLCVEMQVFLVIPPLLILLHINTVIGMLASFAGVLSCWIITGILSADNHWGAQRYELGVEHKDGDLDWDEHYLKAPWCRMGATFVGLMAGAYLAKCGGRVPMKWYTITIGWIFALGTMATIIYGNHENINGDNRNSNEVIAFFNACSRSAWAAAISWIMLACTSGYGGPVSRLLSWEALIPLSRLSLIVYILHPTVFEIYLGNMERPIYLTDTNLIAAFIGNTVALYFVAYIVHIVVDAPLMGLEKAFTEKGGMYL